MQPFDLSPGVSARASFLPATLSLRGGKFGELLATDYNDAKARQTASGLIQGYSGPDHRVIDMEAFFSALVQELREAGRR